jgi:hypothetical protein
MSGGVAGEAGRPVPLCRLHFKPALRPLRVERCAYISGAGYKKELSQLDLQGIQVKNSRGTARQRMVW